MTGIDPYEDGERDGPGMWFWAAAIFLGVVIVVAAAVLFIGGDAEESASTPSADPTATETDDQSTAAVTDGDTCAEFPDSPEDRATTEGAQWSSAGPITYPVSSISGPADKASYLYGTCFAHTVDGAVYAAATAMSIQGLDRASRKSWASEYFIGPGKDEAVAVMIEGPPSDSATWRVTGFRVNEATDDRVDLDLLITLGTDETFRSGGDMRWSDGQWRVYATAEDMGSYPIENPESEGFTQW